MVARPRFSRLLQRRLVVVPLRTYGRLVRLVGACLCRRVNICTVRIRGTGCRIRRRSLRPLAIAVVDRGRLRCLCRRRVLRRLWRYGGRRRTWLWNGLSSSVISWSFVVWRCNAWSCDGLVVFGYAVRTGCILIMLSLSNCISRSCFRFCCKMCWLLYFVVFALWR